MSETTWLIIAIVGFSLSGIALIAAVILFIKMNIPAVIGDLSGKTVAREIKAMRDANASSGDKLHKSSHVNVERGKLTEKVKDEEINSSIMAAAHASRRLDRTGQSMHLKKKEIVEHPSSANLNVRTTESLSSNVGEVDLDARNSTAVLTETNQTEVLTEVCQTEILSEVENATDYDGTTVLSETEELVQENIEPVVFKVTKSIVEIHTDEVI